MSILAPKRTSLSSRRVFKIARVAVLAVLVASAPIHAPVAHGQPTTSGDFSTDASVDPGSSSFDVASFTSTPLTVMPLGDSLTDGYNIPGGYRPDLLARFVADSLPVDFVGSLSNGSAALADREHEGHSGWRIDQISASVAGWMNTYRPDIVLLMIGTNDMVQGYQLSTAPNRLSALIDQITATLPTSHVIVASIPRVVGAPNFERVQAYDATIPGIVDAKVADGKHVSYADIYGVIGPDDLHTDNTHINAGGNTKMANVWYPAIRSALGLPPPADTTPPTVASTAPIGGATGVGIQSNVTATFSEPIDPTTLGLSTFELRNGSGAVLTAAVTYDAATLTATLDPSAPLAAGASYTARVKGGSSDPRIKDTNGNTLASDRACGRSPRRQAPRRPATPAAATQPRQPWRRATSGYGIPSNSGSWSRVQSLAARWSISRSTARRASRSSRRRGTASRSRQGNNAATRHHGRSPRMQRREGTSCASASSSLGGGAFTTGTLPRRRSPSVAEATCEVLLVRRPQVQGSCERRVGCSGRFG